ncbi:Acetokinase family-domain-containing protein [Mycena crocata]|nr:Acetokinase family-domain-containing protein [Mycena crocata]
MSSTNELILSANAGSSSLKISLYSALPVKDDSEPVKPILTSSIIESPISPPRLPNFRSRFFRKAPPRMRKWLFTTTRLLSLISSNASRMNRTWILSISCMSAIASSMVGINGGDYTDPVLINNEAYNHIERLSDLAPLHNGASLEVIKTCLSQLPNAKSIAFFDSAFHRSIPLHIFSYVIDQKIAKQRGLKKYGLHGLSYPHLPNFIILHLGSGASACCIQNGESVDTSMGLTPLNGLSGATRSGAIDPSLILHYTNRAGRMSHDKSSAVDLHVTQAEHILNTEAGWKALTGTTDFGAITERHADDPAAQLTFELFTDRILNYVGSYHLKLGGTVDALVFAGGIGERSKELRERISDRVGCLGYAPIDVKLNTTVDETESAVVDIGASAAGSTLLVCRTDEQLEMARQCILGCM